MEKEPNIFKKDVIKEYGKEELFDGDTVKRGNKIFRVIIEDTSYTIKEYYSHLSDKGAGPGWDFRLPILEKYGVDNPSELPDDPYLEIILEPIEDE